MILEKIPRIECILVIPDSITSDLLILFEKYINKKKSLQILKKKKKRLKTYNYIKNIAKSSNNNCNNNNPEQEIFLKLLSICDFNQLDNIELFNSFIQLLEPNELDIITKFIVKHIDQIINKYIKIIVHTDDQVFVISKLNQDNKKIFLKFFLPKIKKDDTNQINLFDNTINSHKDNIHITLLPTILGHGLDGLFHITFRIEGKTRVIFEYSKFASLNVDSNKLAVGIYPDESCTTSLIFKIIDNLSKLVDLIKLNDYLNINNDVFDLFIYNGLLDYVTFDMLNQLKKENKLNYIFQKYFFSLGKDTIKTIIDKLFRIIICTFIELCFGL